MVTEEPKPKKKTGFQKTLEFLKKYEGFRDTVYLDGNGIPTIGYGFTDPALIKKGKITRAEADRRLEQEVRTREKELRGKIKGWVNLADDSKTALLSYYFNYPAGFKDTTRFMLNWNAGNYYAAIKEVDAGMNDENNPGLRKRRLAELALLNADPYFGIIKKQTPDGINVVNMSDGNKVMTISPRMYEKPQYEPEFKLYHDPKTVYPLDPAAREVPESLDAWNGTDSPSKGPRMPSLTKLLEDLLRDNPLNGGFKPEATIYGRRRLSPLSLKLPSLDQMLDLGSPQQQLTEYFADALQVPRMHLDVLPAAKAGKDALPKYGDGTRMIYNDDGTWSRITDDDEANLLSNLVVTPKGVRPRFDYESNLDYRGPILKNAAISRDDWAATKRDVEKARSTRTWRSDAADAAHAIGEGISTAAGFINPETMVAANAAYNTAKQAAIKLATSNSPAMLYIRYPIGKIRFGLDAQLPTLYRKVKSLPTIENGMIKISTPQNRFAFENGYGEESPLITNFTTDAPVRSHSAGNWDRGVTLAIPGKKLLGKNVISTRPSDTFTYGNDIRVNVEDVTAITGRQKEIDFLTNHGINTITSDKLKSKFAEDAVKYMQDIAKVRATYPKVFGQKGIVLLKPKTPIEDFSNYAAEVENASRDFFTSPKLKDYKFMDYVFRPKYTSETMPVYNISSLESLNQAPQLGEWVGENTKRMYLLDADRWKNVMYDPSTPAESQFRQELNIGLKPEYKK